jgi:hypothetical protein
MAEPLTVSHGEVSAAAEQERVWSSAGQRSAPTLKATWTGEGRSTNINTGDETVWQACKITLQVRMQTQIWMEQSCVYVFASDPERINYSDRARFVVCVFLLADSHAV